MSSQVWAIQIILQDGQVAYEIKRDQNQRQKSGSRFCKSNSRLSELMRFLINQNRLITCLVLENEQFYEYVLLDY